MLLPDYAQALHKSSLPYKDELAKLVRPAVLLHSTPTSQENLPVGTSRLGGIPDLPPEIAWPTWQGKPQSFIAQINLSELPDFSDRNLLPKKGFLFFFYDSAQSTSGMYKSEQSSFAVFYSIDLAHSIQPNLMPIDFEQSTLFKPALLSFTIGPSIPGWEHPLLERLGLSFEERLEYAQITSQVETDVQEQRQRFLHQMLGYPQPMQFEVAWDCERAQVGYWEADKEKRRELEPFIREQVEQWELLLQVDYDTHTGMDWIGSGRIYYMIRRQDLEQRQFNQAWFVLQST
jgi:uncharacterized protein YwqG